MLSLPAVYSAQSSAKNVVNDWLLELSYDDTTPGTFYFSGSDRTVTNFYRGTVDDWGVISEAIDLTKSQAAISDITITLVNKYPNATGLLSTELFGGSKKFYNQDVVIRSWIPGCTAVSHCLTLYKGRLVNIAHDLETVTLTIEKRSPWDRVKLPTNKSTLNNRIFPASFGVFSGTASSTTTPGWATKKSLAPSPVDVYNQGSIYSLTAPSPTLTTYDGWYYEKAVDRFVEMDNTLQITSPDYNGGAAMDTPADMARALLVYPQNVSTDNTFTFPERAIDGTGAYAYINGTSNTTGELTFKFPKIDHKYSKVRIFYQASCQIFSDVGASTLTLNDGTDGSPHSILQLSGVGTDSFNAFIDLDETHSFTEVVADFSVTGATNFNVRVTAVYLEVTTSVDSTDPLLFDEAVKRVETIYTDTLGAYNTWTGNDSTVAEAPHEIYREMLYLYAGWDASGVDFVEVNGVDWSTWAGSGRDWPCRWWTTEQKPLLPILSQIQFEGGFIWIFDEAASGREARIIYVKSSYAATDFDLDYNEIDNIKISVTPFSEIVTKRTFNYQRHPADEKRYLETNSLTNANRGNYNLDAEENAIEQNLDFLTATGDVDDLLEYYDNITGEPKIIVQCDLLNPADWALQVGDIVKFTSMSYAPYGKAWASIYFMCTKTQVSPGKFTATFREVG